ncbi:hypothetical protein HN51_049891 [Arachis hypogaea]
MGELPSIFYKRFKDELSTNLSFYDFSGNELQVIIEKGHCTAIIVASYSNFYMLYGLKQGGWLSICYAGKDKFLNLEVKDHNMRFKEPCFPPIKLSGDIKPSISVKNVIDLFESTDVLNPVLHSVNFPDINVSLNESNQSSSNNSSPHKSPFSVHVVHDFLHKELPVYSDCIADHIQDSVTNNDIPCEMVIGPANISDPFKQVLSFEEVPSSSICPNPLNLLTSRFASQAFPSRFDHVNVIQPDGPNVVMKLRWRSSTSSEAFLTKGWHRFSLKHGLKAGSLLRFTVSSNDETTMSISIISI